MNKVVYNSKPTINENKSSNSSFGLLLFHSSKINDLPISKSISFFPISFLIVLAALMFIIEVTIMMSKEIKVIPGINPTKGGIQVVSLI